MAYLECYERVLNQKATIKGRQAYFYCCFPGCIGYNKRKFNVDLATGAWFCFHCNQEVEGRNYQDKTVGGGTANDFALLMNDDVSQWPNGNVAVAVDNKVSPLTAKKRRQFFTYLFSHCTLSDEHREMLTQRSINPHAVKMVSSREDLLGLLQQEFDEDTIIRGGVAYLDRSGKLCARQCIATGRVLIPYYEEDQVYYFVGYMKCPKRKPDQAIEDYQAIKEGWSKIAGPAGYTPAIYGDIPDEPHLIIITEGQFKAEAAIQEGLTCIGLQGITTGHAGVVKKCIEKKVKRVIICFDTQIDDQETVDWASEKLARELLKVGIPTYRCKLPLEPFVDNGRKMDIDAYLHHLGSANFAEQLSASRRYELRPEEPEGEETEEEVTWQANADFEETLVEVK